MKMTKKDKEGKMKEKEKGKKERKEKKEKKKEEKKITVNQQLEISDLKRKVNLLILNLFLSRMRKIT